MFMLCMYNFILFYFVLFFYFSPFIYIYIYIYMYIVIIFSSPYSTFPSLYRYLLFIYPFFPYFFRILKHSIVQVRSDGCSKFRSSNELWQEQELESIGFMGLCLKKIKRLQSKELKLIDSSWQWTEPHSRRIKILLVVEAEVLNGKASVRQKAVVEFIIKSKKCPYCLREASEHTWGALVQVRQRTAGSKSLIALEDLIVKAGLASLMQSITITKEGLDM